MKSLILGLLLAPARVEDGLDIDGDDFGSAPSVENVAGVRDDRDPDAGVEVDACEGSSAARKAGEPNSGANV